MLKSSVFCPPVMALGPAQHSALVLLLGGAAIHSGLSSFASLFYAATPTEDTTAAPAVATSASTGWTVSLVTALQIGLCCVALGVALGLYLVFKWRSVLGGPAPLHLAVANKTDVSVTSVSDKERQHEASRRTRRGRSGVLEKGHAWAKNPDLV